jgi:hypothetical protein
MRFYGKWAGNPKGIREDPQRCIAEVSDRERWTHFYQCQRKRGKGPEGLYCGIHANMIAKGLKVWVPKDEK